MAGIGDTFGLKLTADTSAWDAAFAKAKTGAASLGDEVGKTGKKTTDVFDGITGGLAKFGLAVEGAKKVLDFGRQIVELTKLSAELKNMEARVPVAQLHQMQAATEGAVGKIELMQFSMRALSGEFRLTERGLDTVLRAANNLADKGFGNTMQNAEALMSALEKGRTRELKQFHITLDETSDKTRNVTEMMKKLQDVGDEKVNVNESLRQIERAQTAWADWVLTIKAGIGDIVWITLRAIGEITGLIEKTRTKDQRIANAGRSAAERIGGGNLILTNLAGDFGSLLPTAQMGAMILEESSSDERRQQVLDATVAQAQAMAAMNRQIQAEAAAQKSLDDQVAQARKLQRKYGTDKGFVGRPGGTAGAGDTTKYYAGGDWQGMLFGVTQPLTSMAGGLGQFFGTNAGVGGTGMDFLSGANFGAPGIIGEGAEDRLARLKDDTDAIGGSLAALTGGLQAAVDAAITGNEAMSTAFLKGTSAVLKGIALKALGLGAFEAAMAWVEPWASGVHLIAAAKLGAVAVLTGGLAAGAGALAGGGGGGSYGASAPAGGGYVSHANANQQQTGGTTIVNINGGIVGTDRKEIAAALNQALVEAEAARRIRPRGSTVTIYSNEAA